MSQHAKVKTTGIIHDTVTGYDFTKDKPLRPRLAIRKKCLECVGNLSDRVKTCDIQDCTLWPFRLGKGTCVDPAGEKVSMRESDGELHGIAAINSNSSGVPSSVDEPENGPSGVSA